MDGTAFLTCQISETNELTCSDGNKEGFYTCAGQPCVFLGVSSNAECAVATLQVVADE